jgi:hypothetical protein
VSLKRVEVDMRDLVGRIARAINHVIKINIPFGPQAATGPRKTRRELPSSNASLILILAGNWMVYGVLHIHVRIIYFPISLTLF